MTRQWRLDDSMFVASAVQDIVIEVPSLPQDEWIDAAGSLCS